VGEAQLEGAKQASRAQDCRSHEPELSQDMLPLLNADPAPMPQILKDVENPSLLTWCELESPLGSVNHPSEDLLPLAPPPFTFAQLLGDGFLMRGRGGIRLREDLLVGRMQDAPADILTLPARALHHPYKVIHKDVDMCNGASVA
jgi:hypothetical protein